MNHSVWLCSLLLRSVAWSTRKAIPQLIVIILLVIYKFRRVHLVDLLWRSDYLLNALRPSWIKLRLIYIVIHKWVLVVLLVLRQTMRMVHTQMETPIIIHGVVCSTWTMGRTVHVEWWVFVFGWLLLLSGSRLNVGLVVCNHFLLILLDLMHFGIRRSGNGLITN